MPNNSADESDLLSVIQAAKVLSRSPRTIQHWIAGGKLAATKLGPGTASYVITRAEVDRIQALDDARRASA